MDLNTDFRSYWNAKLSLWQNLKNLFFSKRPLDREGYFVASIYAFFITLALTLALVIIASPLLFFIDENNQLSEVLVLTTVAIVAFLPLLISFALSLIINLRRMYHLQESAWWLLPIYILSLIPGVAVLWYLYAITKEGQDYLNPHGTPLPEGKPIIYRYYDAHLSHYQNFKNFFFTTQGRLNRLPYFWGNIILNLLILLAQILAIAPTLLLLLLLYSQELFYSLLYTGNLTLPDAQHHIPSLLMILFFGIMFAINIFVAVLEFILKIRRLHDLNYSGNWLLLYVILAFIPTVNFLTIIFDLVLLFKKGTPTTNKYGDNPLTSLESK